MYDIISHLSSKSKIKKNKRNSKIKRKENIKKNKKEKKNRIKLSPLFTTLTWWAINIYKIQKNSTDIEFSLRKKISIIYQSKE